MFYFFKVDLNALFVNSTPASVWTLVGFRPLSSNTFRNDFNTVGPFRLSVSEQINFLNTSMILNINVSPSLNYLGYSYRTDPSAIIHRYRIQLSYFEKIFCERVCVMYRTARLMTIAPLVVCLL